MLTEDFNMAILNAQVLQNMSAKIKSCFISTAAVDGEVRDCFNFSVPLFCHKVGEFTFLISFSTYLYLYFKGTSNNVYP